MRLSWHLVIGAICALFNNVLIIGLAWRGFGYVSATFIVLLPSLLLGYFLHCFFTYRSSPNWFSLIKYTCSMLANYPLWFFALYCFIDLLRAPIEAAAPLTTVLLFFFNYMMGVWVFAKLHMGHSS